MVLDSLFSVLYSKPKEPLTYSEALDYVSYDFEHNMHDIEYLIVDFTILVLCSDFIDTQPLKRVLKKDIIKRIQARSLLDLVRQVKADERQELLEDLCVSDLVTLEEITHTMNTLR